VLFFLQNGEPFLIQYMKYFFNRTCMLDVSALENGAVLW